MRELERRVVLSVLDRKWREHLYEMDYLREGIGLRAYSQRDPLVEYQREGFDLFNAMMDGIAEESVGFLFNLDVQVEAGRRERSRAAADRPRACSGARSRRRCPTPRPARTARPRSAVRPPPRRRPSPRRAAQANAKNKARQKAKQQRKSRKNNR